MVEDEVSDLEMAQVGLKQRDHYTSRAFGGGQLDGGFDWRKLAVGPVANSCSLNRDSSNSYSLECAILGDLH